jgi:hypothetical protein
MAKHEETLPEWEKPEVIEGLIRDRGIDYVAGLVVGTLRTKENPGDRAALIRRVMRATHRVGFLTGTGGHA